MHHVLSIPEFLSELPLEEIHDIGLIVDNKDRNNVDN
jgi:hypothetical protein